jgi:hypothetical protein
MTPIALLIDRCGLSQREAAAALGVRIDTVKSWAAGRNPTPAGVITQLRELYCQIERAAAEALAQIAVLPQSPDLVELGISADDHEAQSLGFPCVGAHAAVLGLVVAGATEPCRIVPRGSTAASAAACDQTDAGSFPVARAQRPRYR